MLDGTSSVTVSEQEDSDDKLPSALAVFKKEALKLRTLVEEARKRFFDFLLANEDNSDLWGPKTGYTFHEFLQAQSICKISEYEAFKRVRVAHPDLTDRVGYPSISAASRVAAENQEDFLKASAEFEHTNGRAQPFETAQKLAREYKSREFVAKTGMVGHAALAAENERLKKIIAERDQTIAALKIEIKSLRKEHSSKAKPSSKPKTKAKK